MTKKQAFAKAKSLKAEGRNVQVAYQTLIHANGNGQQTVSVIYRVLDNGAVIA
jgi:hypothetical protein